MFTMRMLGVASMALASAPFLVTADVCSNPPFWPESDVPGAAYVRYGALGDACSPNYITGQVGKTSTNDCAIHCESKTGCTHFTFFESVGECRTFAGCDADVSTMATTNTQPSKTYARVATPANIGIAKSDPNMACGNENLDDKAQVVNLDGSSESDPTTPGRFSGVSFEICSVMCSLSDDCWQFQYKDQICWFYNKIRPEPHFPSNNWLCGTKRKIKESEAGLACGVTASATNMADVKGLDGSSSPDPALPGRWHQQSLTFADCSAMCLLSEACWQFQHANDGSCWFYNAVNHQYPYNAGGNWKCGTKTNRQNCAGPDCTRYEFASGRVYSTEEVSNQFSEEGTGKMANAAKYAISGMTCNGSYCDNIRLSWVRDYFHGRSGTEATVRLDAVAWTDFFSEEDNSYRACPDGQAMMNMQCHSRWCDNIRLLCGAPSDDTWSVVPFANGAHHRWTNFFSEEQGWAICHINEVAIGVQCQGSRCDNKRFRCAKVMIKVDSEAATGCDWDCSAQTNNFACAAEAEEFYWAVGRHDPQHDCSCGALDHSSLTADHNSKFVPCARDTLTPAGCVTNRFFSESPSFDWSLFALQQGIPQENIVDTFQSTRCSHFSEGKKLRETIKGGWMGHNKYLVKFTDKNGNIYAIVMNGGECWGVSKAGNFDCQGRCGAGCGKGWIGSNWGRDCLKHDVCGHYLQAGKNGDGGALFSKHCGNEFAQAFNTGWSVYVSLFGIGGGACKGSKDTCENVPIDSNTLLSSYLLPTPPQCIIDCHTTCDTQQPTDTEAHCACLETCFATDECADPAIAECSSMTTRW